MKVSMSTLRKFLEEIWLPEEKIEGEWMPKEIKHGLKDVVPLIIGPSGIGKTALIKELAQKRNKKLFVKPLGAISKLDLEYFLVQKDDKAEYLKPSWLQEDSILFFDDVHQASPDVQGVLLEILQNRTFAYHQFPDTLFVIMAMNPVDDEQYLSFIQMTNEFVSRVLQIHVYFNPIEDTKYILPYLHPLVAAFLSQYPSFALDRPEREGIPYPNPRSWEKFSLTLYSIEYNYLKGNTYVHDVREKIRQLFTKEEDTILLMCAYGTVGEQATRALIDFLADMPINTWEVYVNRGYLSQYKDVERSMILVDLLKRFASMQKNDLEKFITRYRNELKRFLRDELSDEMRSLVVDRLTLLNRIHGSMKLHELIITLNEKEYHRKLEKIFDE